MNIATIAVKKTVQRRYTLHAGPFRQRDIWVPSLIGTDNCLGPQYAHAVLDKLEGVVPFKREYYIYL